jgi:hypothetical protein
MGWNTLTTQTAFTLSSPALTTGKLLALVSDAITTGTMLDLTSSTGSNAATGFKGAKITLTGSNSSSSVFTYGMYVSNQRTGTTSNSVGIYSEVASGGLITNLPLWVKGYLGGGLKFGAITANAGAIWADNQTPGLTNSHFSADGTTTTFGGVSLQFKFGNAGNYHIWNANGITMDPAGGASSTGGQRLKIINDPTGVSGYGMISLGAQGNWNAGGTSPFIGSANGTFVAINPASTYAGNFLDFQKAGVRQFMINNAGGIISSYIIAPKAATPYTVLSTESNTVFTNEGATAKIVFNLPTAVAGLTFTLFVQDTDGIDITAASGDTIRFNTTVTAAAGTITSTTIGSSITLVAINATEWVATALVGTWV